jgi:hypothetical protein
MSISRRDFMKLVGISVASLSLTRCRLPLPVTCYLPTLPPPSPITPALARERLRLYWLSFGELAKATKDEFSQPKPVTPATVQNVIVRDGEPTKTPPPPVENTFGRQLIEKHRLALDEMVAAGELTPAVAGLIQEAYEAAVYHVWRSNAPITCYEPYIVNYAPASANTLVQQADVLSTLAEGGIIDQASLAKARAAIEHDMAFYALNDQEVQALYDHILAEWQSQSQRVPAFENVDLEITPDAKAAAEVIIGLLMSR